MSPSIFTLLFTTFLIFPAGNSIDLTNQTCKNCAETAPSPTDFFTFCSASLGAVPISHAANLPGLGLVALELAAENATGTLQIVTEMLQNNTGDQNCTDCLRSCLDLYSDMAAMLRACVADFMATKYDAVSSWVSLVREATAICEEGFGEEGSKSPLTFENYSLSQLCSIVLCIIEELLASPSL